MTTLIIARHGNTFGPGDTPTRVGARTDLPLVESGRAQAEKIGLWLKENNLKPDAVYTSNLKRTIETAEIALETAGVDRPVQQNAIFNEIDYGPDENQPENVVIDRIGVQAIKDWDAQAIVPDGWIVDPQQIIQNWKDFADSIVTYNVVLVVTSNGIARFAPHITGDFDAFLKDHNIKISTGALCVCHHDGTQWAVKEWDIKP